MMAGTTTDRGSVVRGPQHWFFYGVLSVVIVAAVFRFGWLLSLPLTNDETSALMRLQVSGLDVLISEVVWGDGHPMFVQVFLWYWTKWFGTAVWVVKLPFLLCGLGSVVLMVHVGLRLGRPWAGLMSAGMLATLQFPVMYSAIARPYAPGLLLSLWAFYVWLRWVGMCRGDSPRLGDLVRPMVLLALAGYLGASNHYFNGLILALLFVAGLVWLPWRYWLRYLWPWVLMVALYVHQLGIFLHHFQVGSPGWLSVPTWATLAKHVLYSVGYSVWVWVIWIFVGLVLWLSGKIERGDVEQRKGFFTVLAMYVLPMGIAFGYSVFRAPVFQDSVMLFSFPFGLLAAFWWVDSAVLGARWKFGLLVLSLCLNVYVLVVDRGHVRQFNNQSYDGAVRVFQRWGLGGTGDLGHKADSGAGGLAGVAANSDGADEMWVYGFEPFFMEFHAGALGWDLGAWQKSGGIVKYLREETSDYADFRRRLRLVRGDDFYYVNMVGMDPMLRVWILAEFPCLVREAMGAGYHVMHFSKVVGKMGSCERPLGGSVKRFAALGDTVIALSREQYFPVWGMKLDSLGAAGYDAEFVAEAELVVSDSVLVRQDLRLAISIADKGGKVVRFLDRGLGDMGYGLEEVEDLGGGRSVVRMYLAGRMVDVPWGAWLNHGVSGGYEMMVFIDNAGRNEVALRSLGCRFWRGNGAVYGLVNPSIP